MRFIGVIFLFVVVSGISFADDFFNPPPLNNPDVPPWMQDSSSTPPADAASTPDASAPAAAVPEASAPVFSDDESDEGGDFFDSESEDGSSGGGSDLGKKSFQIIGQSERETSSSDCVGWGTPFLGTQVFGNETLCRNELDQNLENARDSITSYADQTEKEVLRGVIKGKIARDKSKDFHLDFSGLKNSLAVVSKTGCKCLE